MPLTTALFKGGRNLLGIHGASWCTWEWDHRHSRVRGIRSHMSHNSASKLFVMHGVSTVIITLQEINKPSCEQTCYTGGGLHCRSVRCLLLLLGLSVGRVLLVVLLVVVALRTE